MKNKLYLNNIELLVSIGVEEEEKIRKQMLIVNIIIEPKNQLIGCTSDNIDDTNCYAKLINGIAEISQSKHFNLLEHFTYSIFEYLNSSLLNHHISVKVTKKIIVNKIQSEVVFEIS